jgi:poly-gamma-glutamate capsule biosynthesis protein CapA/YwtB (metallophosphatase superfamily)
VVAGHVGVVHGRAGRCHDGNVVVLCLTGDVMTGRGVDQILPAPGDPRLWERYATSAQDYVALTEARSGPVPRPVDFSWPWGDALRVLDELAPELRIANVETSITTSDDYAPAKTVLYRMHPGNVGCLTTARLDACALANNHVLDFGVTGLVETLDVLSRAGLGPVGAGLDEEQASRPVVLAAGDGRVLVWSVGSPSSGVPRGWAAGPEGPGVAYLAEDSDADADAICERVRRIKRPGDIAVVSVHWGSNWGYDVPRAQVRLAHRLVDSGVDVVHGHSSHHPRPIEVYHDRLVLYGCGDLVNDYEGIGGHERFRGDLRLLYVARLDRAGALEELRMVPLRSRRMRLELAGEADARWLLRALRKAGRRFGSRLHHDRETNLLELR